MGAGGGGVVVRTRLVGALVLSSFLCGGLRFPFSSLMTSSSSSSSFCLAEEEEGGRMAPSKALPSWHPRGAPRSKTTREEDDEEEDADAAHRWGGSKRIYAFEEEEKEEEEEEEEEERRGKRRDTSLLEDVREEIAFETKKLDIAEATLEKEEDLGFAHRVVADEGDAAKWPLLRQRERNFNRYCLESDDPAMRREMEKLSEHASLYDESNANGNVIIIEAYSPHWNGFGNNMSRYLTLFMVALRFVSFATYFDFGACGWEEYGRSAENDGVEGKAFKRRGNPVHMQSACQFDPGMYFKGADFDWHWTPKRAKENPERLGLARTTRNVTILCDDDDVSADERGCKLYDDADLNHERNRVKEGNVEPLASSGGISREEIDKAQGAEAKIEAANADWLKEWLRKEVERDTEKKGVRVKLAITDVFAMQREGILYSNIIAEKLKQSRGEIGDPELPSSCFNRHFFHPRENVKEAVEDVFEKSSNANMKNWRSCAAIHLRTGFADLQAMWVQMYQALPQNERDALERKYPCVNSAEQFVDALDETFRKCEPDYSNERICTLWHQKNGQTKYVDAEVENEGNGGRLKTFDTVEDCCGSSFREPDVKDAMEHCGFVPEGMYPELEVKKNDQHAHATSPVRAALTCALRASKFHLQSLVDENDDDDGEDAFGVFLLGDSPTFIKAVPKLPNIGKYFAHQPNPDTVGVTMEDNDCSGTSCIVRKKGEKHLSWLRSVVDAYVASLCELTVQLPGSSFANGAIHQLRAPGRNRTSSAFHWSGEVVLGQHLPTRDETTNEIARHTKIGYDGNLENYVALGAGHCKTID